LFASWNLAARTTAEEPDLEQAIAAIQQVGKEGQGHDAAVEAMQVLNRATKAQIPVILAGMDDANPLALNWLRAGIEGAMQRDGEFPTAEVRTYFEDRAHSHLGRLLAFELMARVDAATTQQLVPSLIDDPSMPLRRKAIDYYVERAAGQSEIEAIGSLGFALAHARETDQVTRLREELAKRNVQVDLARQLGFISKWRLAGPFEHADEANFNTPLGPELDLSKIDLAAEFAGKPDEGKPRKVKWITYETSDPNGVVNLNDQIGKIKGAITYGYAEFKSDTEQTVAIRCGCINANKVWVNGDLVINEEVYHNGMDPDQFSGSAKLKAGVNQIVIKVCQNEQTEPWAQEWMFQVRVCDPTGKTVLPAAEPAPQM
jgi:hypothetical protein